ncbi:MAG TPA: 2,3-epoxybenzoyl-CoA dihydrolase [Casimicrobiaceae bacterium]
MNMQHRQTTESTTERAEGRVLFDARPDSYRHWQLAVTGSVATLALAVAEDGGLRPGYKLKLNSYDLGVDIELFDALNRVRFEHPEVRCVVITGGRERLFCSGANIYMLGLSSHTWKVNFCKFTNETRNGMEDSSAYDGMRFLAAVNGACAGGGYELALACDEILLVDDRSSAVSMPEVPLLGVLPGTGGLTRLTDKRRVRRDLADVFCTTTEGVRGQRAVDWGLVDSIAKPADFARAVQERARVLAAEVELTAGVEGKGVSLTPLSRAIEDDSYRYETVRVDIDRDARVANITVHAPAMSSPADAAAALALGAAWYPLKLARELDDAILMLRTNELEIGTWVLRTRGEPELILAHDAFLAREREHWFVRRTIGWLRRALTRLEVSARSLFALVDREGCFAGTLFELALAADRSYMLDAQHGPAIVLSEANFALYPTLRGIARLAERFGEPGHLELLRQHSGEPLAAARALELGLVTSAPDDIDWDDEVRIAIEERASFSPDALTGLEQNLRFGGAESMATRIFGRLSAWQNWIFTRPNAVGEHGALKVFGTGTKAKFDWKRT